MVFFCAGTQDTQSNYWLGCVHVEDVAKAQILLYETPSASGRYLCTNGIIHFSDFAKVVAKTCPEYPIHRYDISFYALFLKIMHKICVKRGAYAVMKITELGHLHSINYAQAPLKI